MCVCVCVCIYIYIYIYTHARAYAGTGINGVRGRVVRQGGGLQSPSGGEMGHKIEHFLWISAKLLGQIRGNSINERS